MNTMQRIWRGLRRKTPMGFVVLSALLSGCTAMRFMDLRVDTVQMSDQFGRLPPRVSTDVCKYYTKGNAPGASTYTVLAQYIIQEEPEVVASHSAQDMIGYAYSLAVKNGADAIIVEEVGTVNMSAGFAAKTTPIVKVLAIRFNGEPPVNGKPPVGNLSGDTPPAPYPADYQDVVYGKLGSETFVDDYKRNSVHFKAMFIGEWTIVNVYSTGGVRITNRVFINHRDISYAASETGLGSSDIAFPPFALSLTKEKSDIVYELKRGDIVEIWGKTEETSVAGQRGLHVLIDRIERISK